MRNLRNFPVVAVLGIVAFGQTTPKWLTTDYDTQRSRAATLLKGKRLSDAKALAAELNRRVPDDVEIYGILAEAQIELGEYEAAEKNVNWMTLKFDGAEHSERAWRTRVRIPLQFLLKPTTQITRD